jgi:single-strand DNA-binding protein
MNLNKAQVIGRVTRDLESKSLPNGTTVCSFSMATNYSYKDKEGKKVEETDFHNLVSFGKQAEILAQYVKKGQLLMVEGRMKTRSWDDKETSKKMYRTEIIIDQFQFGPKAANAGSTARDDFDGYGDEPQAGAEEEVNPDDIPF